MKELPIRVESASDVAFVAASLVLEALKTYCAVLREKFIFPLDDFRLLSPLSHQNFELLELKQKRKLFRV